MSALAKSNIPTFVAGPVDTLITKDVYSIKSSAVINQAPASSGSIPLTEKTMGLLGSSVIAALQTKEALNVSKSTVNNNALLARAGSIIGTAGVSVLRDLNPSAASILSKGLSVAGPILATVGNVTSLISGAKANGALAFGNMINTISKTSSVVMNDKVGLLATGNALLNGSSSLGLPNIFPQVMAGIGATGNISAITKIGQSILPMAAKASNIPMLGSIGSMATKGSVTAAIPGAISMFSSMYKKETTGTPLTNLNSATAAFTSADANWNRSTRTTGNLVGDISKVDVPDVSSILSASPAFKETVVTGATASNNPMDKDLLMGTMFPSTNNASSVQYNNPATVLTSTSPPPPANTFFNGFTDPATYNTGT